MSEQVLTITNHANNITITVGLPFLRAVRDGDHPEDLGDLPQETVI